MAIDVKKLNKGHVRKLTALRKSLGDKIADEAFAAWFKELPSKEAVKADAHAAAIHAAVEKAILSGKIKIPKKGYIVKRGRGKVIVEAAK